MILDPSPSPTLERAAFARYLAALSPRANVGYPGTEYDCPLTRWLKTLFPEARRIAVSPGFIRIWHGETFVKIETPDWAHLFLRAADSCGVRWITAGRARKILESIPQ